MLRTAHGAVVLHVAVDVIGHSVIHGDVVHLPDGQRHAMDAAAVVGGDVHAAVVGDDNAIGVPRIHPDIVRVAAPGQVAEDSCRRRSTARKLLSATSTSSGVAGETASRM